MNTDELMRIAPLRQFISDMDGICCSRLISDVPDLAVDGMRDLVADDSWLPDAMSTFDPFRYQQHLLYADALDRFSIVSFVWAPGQATPIHNHMTWGVIGVLRGAECSQRYELSEGAPVPLGKEIVLGRGQVDIVSADPRDVHLVRNACAQQVSISIHLYGRDIGRVERSTFDPYSGKARPFVSGYASTFDWSALSAS